MSSLNKVMLIGRLGKDPEVKTLPNGEAVCNVSLATSETWKDKAGNRQEKTEWHNLTFFRRTAEVAGQFLKKGSLIYVEGKISTRKYQDKEGNERYATDIIVNNMTMMGKKDEEMGGDMDGAPARQAPARQAPAPAAQSRPAPSASRPAARPAPSFNDIPGDDIPF